MFQHIYLFNILSCTTPSPVFKVTSFGLHPAIIRLIHYLEKPKVNNEQGYTQLYLYISDNIYINIQVVPRVKVTTSGECSLC